MLVIQIYTSNYPEYIVDGAASPFLIYSIAGWILNSLQARI